MVRWFAALALILAAPVVAEGVPQAAYVVMGAGGAIARVVTAGDTCPVLTIGGHARAMVVRFAAATAPLRPTASTPENSKKSVFPLVCDAPLARGARHASIGGVALPVPKSSVRRLVVIGDTGCRIKAADHAAQACNDPAAFPFARIAAAAAREKPDLVIHVGDYLYRENPCPAATAGCANSPWGYGGEAWAADFLIPAAPLLAAAPWAPARGNHESCVRAGQGWWRFLDGHAAVPGHDCDAAANDEAGDWSPPYAVPLGCGAQLVMLDLAATPNKPVAADDWRRAAFERSYQDLAALAANARLTFAVDHQPILGCSATNKRGPTTLVGGNVGIQSVWGRHGVRQLPPHVDVLRSGHYHLWQQVSFAGDVPSQFITGFFRYFRGCRAPAGANGRRCDACAGDDGRGVFVVDRRFRLYGP